MQLSYHCFVGASAQRGRGCTRTTSLHCVAKACCHPEPCVPQGKLRRRIDSSDHAFARASWYEEAKRSDLSRWLMEASYSVKYASNLGSSSFITDATGTAVHHMQHLPFGEPKRLLALSSRTPLKIISECEQTFVEQRASKVQLWYTPYKFSGKEKDEETSLSYFGARYYDSVPITIGMSVWLSVDQLSDKYPHQSPYMYCSGNPVMRIDPNGMNDIGFVIDKTGHCTKVTNGGGADIVFFSQAAYDAGTRDYDATGTKSGIIVKAEDVSNIQSKKFNFQNSWGEDLDETAKRISFEVKSKVVTDNLFCFFEKNTLVEWSNQNFTDPKGKSVNVITTSFERKTITEITTLTTEYLAKGYKLNLDEHSHPWDLSDGAIVTSKYGENGGIGTLDYGRKEQILKLKGAENAIFKMRFQGYSKQY